MSDIYINDVFMLNYYGIRVIFQVANVSEDEKEIYLVELATKRYKDGYTLTKNLDTSKNPFIIKKNNARTKTTYKVSPNEDGTFYVLVPMYSKLFWEALKYVEYPKTGYVLAVPFKDYLNTYWEEPVKIKEIENYC